MEATQPAPDAAAEPVQPVTPEADPAPEQDAAAESAADADQSQAEPDRLLAQAEFTRSQQAFASLKSQLGLDKKATREDVIEAVRVLREQPAAQVDDEGEELDPRIADAEQRAFKSEMRVMQAVYGEDFTQDAITAIDIARSTNDPETLIAAFAAFAQSHGRGAAAAETDDDDDETDDDQPRDIGTSEGDRSPSAQTTTQPAPRGESGTVSAVRGIFQKAGIGTRQPPAP